MNLCDCPFALGLASESPDLCLMDEIGTPGYSDLAGESAEVRQSGAWCKTHVRGKHAVSHVSSSLRGTPAGVHIQRLTAQPIIDTDVHLLREQETVTGKTRQTLNVYVEQEIRPHLGQPDGSTKNLNQCRPLFRQSDACNGNLLNIDTGS